MYSANILKTQYDSYLYGYIIKKKTLSVFGQCEKKRMMFVFVQISEPKQSAHLVSWRSVKETAFEREDNNDCED